MRKLFAPVMIAFVVTACSRVETNRQNEVLAGNELTAANEPANADLSIEPGAPGGLPDNRNLVAESQIDPASGQGGGQVLQSYAALLEQGRFADARRLWTDGGTGSGLSQEGFVESLAKYSEIHAEIGAPGPVEGAAGSAYVEIPLRLYGKLKSGRGFNALGTATLRRVNDVPGSSEAQRRWHIYRIDVQPPL